LIPGLWRCGPFNLVDLAGILIHPVGLLALFGISGLLRAFRYRGAAELVSALLFALGVEALALTVLSLIAAVSIRALGGNPTPVLEGAQYVGIAVSWGTAGLIVFRAGKQRLSEEPRPALAEHRADVPTVRDFFVVSGRVFLLLTLEAALVMSFSFVATMVAYSIVGTAFALLTLSCAAFGGVAGLVIFHQRRRAKRKPPQDFAAARRAGVAPMSAIAPFLALLGIVLLLTGPLFHRDSYLRVLSAPYELARWLFELNTAPIATDECLASRNIELPSEPVFGELGLAELRTEEKYVDQHDQAFGFSFPDPARPAGTELYRRKASASPGTLRVLRRVLNRGNASEQDRAVPRLRLLASEHGAHPLLQDWAMRAKGPDGRQAARRWLVCIRKNRRDLIGQDINEDCVSKKELVDAQKRAARLDVAARNQRREQACIARGRPDLASQDVNEECRTDEEEKQHRWRQWAEAPALAPDSGTPSR